MKLTVCKKNIGNANCGFIIDVQMSMSIFIEIKELPDIVNNSC